MRNFSLDPERGAFIAKRRKNFSLGFAAFTARLRRLYERSES